MYDANVLLALLDIMDTEGVRFDKRRDISAESLDLKRVMGLIINKETNRAMGMKHWFCIRKINGIFYNLDSLIRSPYPFLSLDELLSFLLEEVVDCGGDIIKVYQKNKRFYSPFQRK